MGLAIGKEVHGVVGLGGDAYVEKGRNDLDIERKIRTLVTIHIRCQTAFY